MSIPTEAWGIAVRQMFPDSESSRSKSCPRSTFLGLCEEGLIHGVEPGNYTHSVANKNYAITAITELRNNPSLALNQGELWRLVTQNSAVQENSQMDVVITLWENNLIV